MLALLQQILQVLAALWNISNGYVRAAIRIAVYWPLVLFLAALLTSLPDIAEARVWIIPTLALVPFFGLLIFLANWRDPLVLAIIARFAYGREVLRWVVTLFGVELGLGVIFGVFPVAADPKLIPLFFLALATLALLSLGGHGGLAKLLRRSVLFLVAVLAVIFLLGGRDKASEKAKNLLGGDTSSKPIRVASPRSVAAPNASPSREIVRTLTLVPNTWSEWVELGPNTRWTVDWKTADRKIEYEVLRMGESRPETMAAEYGKPSDMGSYIEKFRCRHPSNGTVTVTIKPF